MGRRRGPGLQRDLERGAEAPEEASLVDNVVLLHDFAPVSLKLLDPSLLGLGGLYVPLLQVPEQPDGSQRNCPLSEAPKSKAAVPAQFCPQTGPISPRQLKEGRT